jgi:hydrogenase/urease accessory protein HupE
MTRSLARWSALLACGWMSVALAHPLAPALLQLRESTDGTIELLWRASLLRGLDVTPQLPESCTRSHAQADGDGVRWVLHCEGGLAGKSLSVPHLDRAGINVIVQIEHPDGSVQKALLDATRPHYTVQPPAQAPPVFPSYLQLGVEHLAFGFDHLLFVAALVLLVPRPRRLLVTVTAFTLGHSITLALATLGFLAVDPRVTELAIALSLLLLACHLARDRQAASSGLDRWPATMAGAFGLLHGLGFAGALAQIGLPSREIPMALLAFNLGIEIGQILLVIALLGIGAAWRRMPLAQFPPRSLAQLAPVYAIGTLATYWTLERATAMTF